MAFRALRAKELQYLRVETIAVFKIAKNENFEMSICSYQEGIQGLRRSCEELN
jgi:hypothetical protein